MVKQPAFVDQAVVELARALGHNLIGIVLYGSYARGEARADSDVDLFVVARGLSENWYDRQIELHTPFDSIEGAPPILVLGKTPEEFEAHFPSLYLDIGLDGVILYDQDGYISRKLDRIREIIKDTGLVRERLNEHNMFWDWDRAPARSWEITWEGYREIE